MRIKRVVIGLSSVAVVLVLAVSAHATPITGTYGSITLTAGPHPTLKTTFTVTIEYEAFTGTSATDPLGITPGYYQYAYTLELTSDTSPYPPGSNEAVRRFTVVSIYGFPLIDATWVTGSYGSLSSGTQAPSTVGYLTIGGYPAVRWLFDTDPAYNLDPGEKSYILVYKAPNTSIPGMVHGGAADEELEVSVPVGGPTPEPTTLILLGTGIAGIAGAMTRRRKKNK